MGSTQPYHSAKKTKLPRIICNVAKKEPAKGLKVNAHIFSVYDVNFWVAKSETVLPPALHQWYIHGAKFKDCIRLLVDERHF